MKFFLGDSSSNVRKEDNYKPTIGNESLHEISSDNGVRDVDFSTSKNSNCHEHNIPTSQHS
jgi:hypothetical protein